MAERDDDDNELLGLSLGLGSGHPEKNRRRSSASAPRPPSLELNLSLAGHARDNPPESSQAHRRHPISCNLQLRHPGQYLSLSLVFQAQNGLFMSKKSEIKETLTVS